MTKLKFLTQEVSRETVASIEDAFAVIGAGVARVTTAVNPGDAGDPNGLDAGELIPDARAAGMITDGD